MKSNGRFNDVEETDIEKFASTEKGKKIVEAAVVVLETAIFALGVLLIILKSKGFLMFPIISFILMKLLEIIFLGNDRKNPEKPILLSSLAIIIGCIMIIFLGTFFLPKDAQLSSLVLALAWVVPSILLVNVFNLSFMLITSITRSTYHLVKYNVKNEENINVKRNNDKKDVKKEYENKKENIEELQRERIKVNKRNMKKIRRNK